MKKNTLHRALIFLAVFLFLLAQMPSRSDAFLGLFEKTQAPPPEEPKTITEKVIDDASFKQHTKMYADIPFDDTTLEYEIYLPSDWENLLSDVSGDSSDLNRKILGKVGNYRSPLTGGARSQVSIYAIELEHEIAAKDWLENHILSKGYGPEGKISAPNAKTASVSYVALTGVIPFHVLAKAQVYGTVVILIEMQIPLALKEQLSFLQKKSTNSFKLRSPKDGTIENVKWFTITDAMKFSYPDSWKVAYPDFKDPSRASMQLQNRSSADKIEGLIQFMAVSRQPETNIKKEIGLLRDHITGLYNIDVREMLSTGRAPVYSRFLFSRQESYSIAIGKDGSAEQEIWLAVLGDQDWYIFIYLITPKRINNIYSWGRNTRALQLVLESIK